MKGAYKRKGDFAIFLVFLIIIGIFPYNGMGISYAAAETVSNGDGRLITKKYMISWNVAGNGVVEINDEVITKNNIEVMDGEQVIFNFRPDPKYQVTAVSVNGSAVEYKSNNDKGSYYQFTLSDISEDTNIQVTFDKIPLSSNKISFESLDLLLLNEEGAVQFLNNENTCYAKSYIQICSQNNYVYRIKDSGQYKAQCLWGEENNAITYIYKRDIDPAKFGTEQMILLKEPIYLVIDTIKPQINVKETIWTSNKHSICLCAEVEDDNPDYIVWCWDTNEIKNEIVNGKFETLEISDLFLTENKKTIYVYAVDKAGNCSSTKKMDVGYDNTPPEITDIQIDTSSTVSKLLDGNFSNHAVVLNVTACDLESGVETVEVYTGSDSEPYIGTCSPGGNNIKVTIPYVENGYFSELRTVNVRVKDSVGNTSHYYTLSQFQSTNNIKNDKLLMESALPTAKISVIDSPSIYKNNQKVYFRDTVMLEIEVEDKGSGLQKTAAKVLGNNYLLYMKDYTAVSSEKYEKDTYSVVVNAAEEANIKNNIYEVAVNVTDSAGNNHMEPRKFYRDVTAPRIVGYEMISDETDVLIQDGFSIVETDYGYYFRDKTLVKIYASDGDGEADCGVNEIQYYTIDSEGVQSMLNTSKVKVDSQRGSYIEVEIEGGFKGQLYACAFDNLMNHADKFVGPKGTIIDTPEYHEMETHIQFQKPDALAQDNGGRDLYSNDVNITVTITDKMSGIQSVEWSVKAPYDMGNNQAGYLEITNEGILASDSDGWEIITTEKNLVTEAQKNILVSNNSNNIEITVEMKDRSGNVTQDQIVLSIDKTNPEIEVVFDNNDSDPEYKEVFNSNRTATIIVKEWNFVADGIVAEITNTEGPVPEISAWNTQIDENNPHESINTATITFSNDGDYAMEISGEDAAHNRSETVVVDKFIIDKTLPQIQVSFDNNNAMNENYYSETRTAMISITEHNFTPKRVTITGNVPPIGSWKRNGDIYTTNIICEADGLYNFEVEYLDKAGNKGDKFVSDSYYVDKTAPTIEITGVEAFSANNGDVIPEISMSDTNYDVNGVDIQVVGANNGVRVLNGEFIRQEAGQIYTFENFPKELEYDDIYTIHVAVRDLAGNETTDEITFSVNRFGSVYIFDTTLEQIVGTYIPKATDVKFTEINLDSLEHDTIKIIVDANGVSRNLAEGIDYTVKQSHASGTWYQYDYDIDNSVFADDGRYIVTLYSEDDAGNVNQNINETKKAEIRFGVDKTAPVVIPIDMESGSQYPVDVKSATIAVNDNLVLKSVDIYIDSKKYEYTINGENYIFDVPNADWPQTITIVATDSAGNVTRYEIKDILVTTNLFIRWYNNKPLLAGSLLCGLAVSGGGIGLFSFLRQRRFRAYAL